MRQLLIDIRDRYFGENISIEVKRLNVYGIGGIIISLMNVILAYIQGRNSSISLVSLCMALISIVVFIKINHFKYCNKCPYVICGLLNLIGFPALFIFTNGLEGTIPYYYIFGIILTFMMISGRGLLYMLALEVIAVAVSYSYVYYHLPIAEQMLQQSRYISSFISVVAVSSVVGIEFFVQTRMYSKKELENQRQRLLLEEYVTSIQAAKNEAEQAKQDAEKANVAKSQFLATMSHEIRTPMNAILGMSEIILKDDIDMEMRDRTQSIHRAAKSLLAIINDILDLTKIESGKMELINVRYQPTSLFNDVISMIQFRLEDRPIELVVDVDNSMPCELYGDEVRIRQVLINLLNNAVKYTNCGTITFSARWKKCKGKANIEISIKDTGIGIKEDEIHKLFSTFERLDKRKNYALEGSGLGLSICKQILDLMGGTITVQSEYGKGSTFTISISQQIINSKPIQKMSYKPVEIHKNTVNFVAPDANVLIVDDNVVNLKVAEGLMASHRFNIDTACSGEECLALLETKRYDLIFMDHMMPHLDGIDTMRLIKENGEKYGYNLSVIALTANAVAGAKELFMQEGFCDYMSKPINVIRLERILLRHLPKHLVQKATKIEEQVQEMEMFIDGVDTIVGAKQANGNITLYKEVLAMYHKETSRLRKDIKELIDKDMGLFIINIHSIKGSSRNIGALELAELAEELELAARTEDIGYIRRRIDKCIEVIDMVLEGIDKYLQSLNKIERSVHKKVKHSLNMEVLQALLEGFDNFDLEAIEEQIKELKQYTYSQEVEKFIETLVQCAENLDYEIGSKEVKEYLSSV